MVNFASCVRVCSGRYWEMVQRLRINQFYGAPTAIRLLLKYEDDFVKKYDRSSLKTLGCGTLNRVHFRSFKIRLRTCNFQYWYFACHESIMFIMRTKHTLAFKTVTRSCTVGEPLNHDAWEGYYNVVGEKRCPVVDTWWQTGNFSQNCASNAKLRNLVCRTNCMPCMF